MGFPWLVHESAKGRYRSALKLRVFFKKNIRFLAGLLLSFGTEPRSQERWNDVPERVPEYK